MLGSLTRSVMLRRAALGTAGVVALGLARREQAFASASGAAPADAALGALWGEAIDGMINVPGCEELSHDGVLYLAPTKGAPPPVKWPPSFKHATDKKSKGTAPLVFRCFITFVWRP